MGARKNIGELLVREKLIDLTQLEQAKKDQKQHGGRLSSALVRMGYVQDSQMANFLSAQFGVAAVDLENFEIDPEALKAIPRDVCEKHMVIPVSKSGNTLIVAFADPGNMFVRDDLNFISRCKVEVLVAPEMAIQKAIERSYPKTSKDKGHRFDHSGHGRFG